MPISLVGLFAPGWLAPLSGWGHAAVPQRHPPSRYLYRPRRSVTPHVISQRATARPGTSSAPAVRKFTKIPCRSGANRIGTAPSCSRQYYALSPTRDFTTPGSRQGALGRGVYTRCDVRGETSDAGSLRPAWPGSSPGSVICQNGLTLVWPAEPTTRRLQTVTGPQVTKHCSSLCRRAQSNYRSR
jgi:hypothetical protein